MSNVTITVEVREGTAIYDSVRKTWIFLRPTKDGKRMRPGPMPRRFEKKKPTAPVTTQTAGEEGLRA